MQSIVLVLLRINGTECLEIAATMLVGFFRMFFVTRSLLSVCLLVPVKELLIAVAETVSTIELFSVYTIAQRGE